jgi:hypothetical protein
LTSIIIPSNVTEIGAQAFYSCASLTSITVPSGVTKIGDGAFGGMYKLKEIVVAAGNTAYCSEGGVLFDFEKTLLLCYPADKEDKEYIIPTSVTSIANYAFSGSSNLTSVTVPSGVTEIGERTFSGCDSLERVEFSNSVTEIGDKAFAFCVKLKDIIYHGTKAEWEAIAKSASWNTWMLSGYTVHCSDGDIETE